jgi:hypothetical protein
MNDVSPHSNVMTRANGLGLVENQSTCLWRVVVIGSSTTPLHVEPVIPRGCFLTGESWKIDSDFMPKDSQIRTASLQSHSNRVNIIQISKLFIQTVMFGPTSP